MSLRPAMRASEFLRYAAFCVHAARPIKTARQDWPRAWVRYTDLVRPDAAQAMDPAVQELRSMRLCLAAAIAESEGD